MNKRLRIALPKKGRLHSDTMELLSRCGLKFRFSQHLLAAVENLPIDILLVRDSDIPVMVMTGVCDLGIVGENTLLEKQLLQQHHQEASEFSVLSPLNFGHCRLSLAIPEEKTLDDIAYFSGLRIATTYPYVLKQYLQQNSLQAEVIVISGSVEIAPRLGMADAVCDLVSTGRTLQANHLREVVTLLESQAVLIQSAAELQPAQQDTRDLLLRRVHGVLQAKESKYILFHIKKAALPAIEKILPGVEAPTVLPLASQSEKVAVHLVSAEAVFWSTLEQLKSIGASSILVLPIEKMMS